MSTSTITGTPVTSAAGDGNRRSLRNIRRILARALHSLSVVTTTTAGAAAGTSVVASRLATSVTTSRYRNSWVLPVSGASAGELSRVKAEEALNLTTGELTVSPAFTAQIASGVEVEIHRLLPPIDDDGWTGLRTLINNALRELWVADRVTITGVTGQPSYSLSTYEEWLDPQAVVELRGQALDSTLNPFPMGTFDPVRDADSLTVQVAPTLPGGESHSLEVFRPLDTWIKVGGVWAASTTGFVNDSDECLSNPDLVSTVALAHTYEALASGPDGGRYEEMARRQRRKANLAKLGMLDHRQRRTRSGLMTVGGVYDAKTFDGIRYGA
jgi:hypothetical protein